MDEGGDIGLKNGHTIPGVCQSISVFSSSNSNHTIFGGEIK
jgi:hypothetical protein